MPQGLISLVQETRQCIAQAQRAITGDQYTEDSPSGHAGQQDAEITVINRTQENLAQDVEEKQKEIDILTAKVQELEDELRARKDELPAHAAKIASEPSAPPVSTPPANNESSQKTSVSQDTATDSQIAVPADAKPDQEFLERVIARTLDELTRVKEEITKSVYAKCKLEANQNGIAAALQQDCVQTLHLLTTAFQEYATKELKAAVEQCKIPSRNASDVHNNAEMEAEKFSWDIRTMRTMKSGNIEHFRMGLDEFNGRPVGDNIETQMKLEFLKSDHSWIAKNAGHQFETDLQTEWEFVVNPDKGKEYPAMRGQDNRSMPCREVKEIQEFMDLEITLVPSALCMMSMSACVSSI